MLVLVKLAIANIHRFWLEFKARRRVPENLMIEIENAGLSKKPEE